jgi:Asp-tRNA(Asn)/Glu-tRNA(Gln) amidotransferase A subunit family amidase
MDAQVLVMSAESASSLAWEMAVARDQLSEGLRDRMEWGLAQSPEALDAALAVMRGARLAFAGATADVDVLLTPSAPGEAPEGIAWTGDPAFNALWTALHVPCVTVPAGTGPAGMPLGIQLVGRLGEDRAVLAAAHWVGAALAWG